jgi:hypothetical protein
MDPPLILAVVLLLLLLALIVVGFRRGRRRVRAELVGLRRRHNEALASLVERGNLGLRWEVRPGDDVWAALSGSRDGVSFRLAGESRLRRTTFIEYVSRLSLIIEGAGFELADLPGEIDGDAFALLQPRVPEDICASLEQLAQNIRLQPDRVVITAMPTAELRRYSYAFCMQVSPETLAALVETAAALAVHLRR